MSKTRWDYHHDRFGSLEETAEHYIYPKVTFGFTVWCSVHSRQSMFKTREAALAEEIAYLKAPVTDQWVKNMRATLVQEDTADEG